MFNKYSCIVKKERIGNNPHQMTVLPCLTIEVGPFRSSNRPSNPALRTTLLMQTSEHVMLTLCDAYFNLQDIISWTVVYKKYQTSGTFHSPSPPPPPIKRRRRKTNFFFCDINLTTFNDPTQRIIEHICKVNSRTFPKNTLNIISAF